VESHGIGERSLKQIVVTNGDAAHDVAQEVPLFPAELIDRSEMALAQHERFEWQTPRRGRPRQKRRSGRRPAHSTATPISSSRTAGRNIFRRDTPGTTPAPEWEGSEAKHSPKSGSAGGDCSRHHLAAIFENLHVVNQGICPSAEKLFDPAIHDSAQFQEAHSRTVRSCRGENTSRGRFPALPFPPANQPYQIGEARRPATSRGNRCQKRMFANTVASVLRPRADFPGTNSSWDRK